MSDKNKETENKIKRLLAGISSILSGERSIYHIPGIKDEPDDIEAVKTAIINTKENIASRASDPALSPSGHEQGMLAFINEEIQSIEKDPVGYRKERSNYEEVSFVPFAETKKDESKIPSLMDSAPDTGAEIDQGPKLS